MSTFRAGFEKTAATGLSTDTIARALTNRALKTEVPQEHAETVFRGMKHEINRYKDTYGAPVNKGHLPKKDYRKGLRAMIKIMTLPKP